MSNSEVIIRTAVETDVPQILGLIRALGEYEKLAHEVVATEEGLRRRLFGPEAVAEVLMAEYQDEVAGFALFFPNFSTFLGRPGMYLEDLFVRPELRGKGIGQALLRRLARLAVERGCGRMEWAVLDWNEAAIRFYRKLGAVAMDEWTIFRLTGEALQKVARESEEGDV